MKPQAALSQFLDQLNSETNYKKIIGSQSKAFDINPRELIKFTPHTIKKLQDSILNIQKEQQEDSNDEWNDPERKLLNWVLMLYLQYHSKTVSQLTDHDFEYLSEITSQKPIPLLKYYVKSIVKHEKRPKWNEQQDRILHQILAVQQLYKPVGMWSLVSKELFLRGDQTQYKSGKNCRERWYNYVNPLISKDWTVEQDLILMQSVQTDGKKWSSLIPKLGSTKSEHMIKNRYFSLLKKEKDYTPAREESTVQNIIKKLSQEVEKKKKLGQKQLFQQKEVRVLRSNSLKKEAQVKGEQVLKRQNKQQQGPQMFMLSSNPMVNLHNSYQLFEEDPQKIDFKFLQIIREDAPSHQQHPKANKDFNPYESLRFTISSPLPLTPSPATLLSCIHPSPGPQGESSFKNKFQQFQFHLKQ